MNHLPGRVTPDTTEHDCSAGTPRSPPLLTLHTPRSPPPPPRYSPGLTMGRRQHVFAVEQHSSALVLGEESEEGGLLHHHLPGPGAEVGRLAAYDSDTLPASVGGAELPRVGGAQTALERAPTGRQWNHAAV